MSGLFDAPPFGLDPGVKRQQLLDALRELCVLHHERCVPYRAIIDKVYAGRVAPQTLEDVPYLPVQVFKTMELRSVPAGEVVRVMLSSGTTGHVPSRIVLDGVTSGYQSRALSRILQAVLGPTRLPMLVIDHEATIRNRAAVSARTAAVLGMMTVGARAVFALDEELQLDAAAVDRFLTAVGDRPFLVFGFTFLVWQFLEQARGRGWDMRNATLVHGGGWKKLAERAVDNRAFRAGLADGLGITRAHSFYGMVEQVGSVFLEGEDGLLYAPSYADVIVRDPVTWQPLPAGRTGVIQVLSCLPRSYPGHSLLTEDLGVLVHEDRVESCGWHGRAFQVLGRLPRTELRGCSDTRPDPARGPA